MAVCKKCGKQATWRGFCSDCGTSIYVVSDEEYEIYLIKNKLITPTDIPVSKNDRNAKRRLDLYKEIYNSGNSISKKSRREKKLQCTYCSFKASSEIGIIHHRITKHNESFISKSSGSEEFSCEKCSRWFTSEIALIQHKMDVHKQSFIQ